MVSSALGHPLRLASLGGFETRPLRVCRNRPYVCALTLREGDMWRCGYGEKERGMLAHPPFGFGGCPPCVVSGFG